MSFAPKTEHSSGFVLAKRLVKWLKEPSPLCFGPSLEQYFSCRNPYGRWDCELIGMSCVETAAANPPAWGLQSDIVLANMVFLRKDNGWVAGASLPLAVNVVPSRKTPRRVYLDREVADLSVNFTSATIVPNGSHFNSGVMTARGPNVDQIMGAYRSMVSSLAENPSTEVVLAADNEYIHRIVATSKGWRNDRMFKLSGDVQQLISADLRGDGIERVYIVENVKNAQKGHVLELTYFPRRPRVSVSPFIVKDARLGSDNKESQLLSELISQELVDTDVIQVIEEDQRADVDRERAFRGGLCADDACRAKFAQAHKADYLVAPIVIRESDGARVEIALYGSGGQLKRTIRRSVKPGERLLEAVRQAAKDLIRVWSETPQL